MVRRSKGWHIYDSESGESSYSFTGRILESRHTCPYVKREWRVIIPVYKSAFLYTTKQGGGIQLNGKLKYGSEHHWRD